MQRSEKAASGCHIVSSTVSVHPLETLDKKHWWVYLFAEIKAEIRDRGAGTHSTPRTLSVFQTLHSGSPKKRDTEKMKWSLIFFYISVPSITQDSFTGISGELIHWNINCAHVSVGTLATGIINKTGWLHSIKENQFAVAGCSSGLEWEIRW